MNEAVDIRKWSAKWRNWNIYDIFFSLSSTEGQKQRRQPETFAPCMGTMPSERARQENGFLVLRTIVLTLVTLHVQKDLRGLMKIVLNTLIHNDPRQCTLELIDVMNCNHSSIVDTFEFNGQGSKLGCMGTACSKPTLQKSASGHMCVSACSSSIGS